jgi:ABC-type sulfate transport system permease component
VKILPLVIYTHVSELSADIAKADALAIVLTLVTTGVIIAYEKFFTSPSSAR